MDEEDWVRILDYSNYLCRSWQNLYFKSVVARLKNILYYVIYLFEMFFFYIFLLWIFRYIRIVGVRNTANRIFHLVSMEVRYTLDRYDLFSELIVPNYNVASSLHSSCVLEGVSRTRNALINGDYKNYDWDSGYTCHQLGSGWISIHLAQPYLLSSMR